ncbi:MAG: SDR family oxidoreductase [Anaerolineae bacterium]|nr:SDR family oxidoreductase [Anaerolineae bacterium]
MTTPLTSKIAVVTGASHGLGEAIAAHLASLGSGVALIARDPARLEQAAARISSHSTPTATFPCDVSNAVQVQAIAAAIIAQMGRVDILVNNAGIPAPRTFEETGFADWDAVIGVNLSGAFYIARALWDALVASGAGYVINISGTAGVRGGGSPAYGSAKFGLTGLNHAIAAAGQAHNLRSTILYPGGMDTGWRGAPIGVKPRAETMDPNEVARLIGQLVTSPPEFVVNEAVLNPIANPYL